MAMTTVRQWHSYIGLFTAPSVLFFTLTGAAQLFNLHEAHGDYRPPAIVEKLSSVHKDQVFAFGHHHAPSAAESEAANPAAEAGAASSAAEAGAASSVAGAAPPAGSDDDDDKVKTPTFILKGFFLLVALCLALSTSLGIWMGLTQTRRRRLAWSLVVAGALIPAGLLFF